MTRLLMTLSSHQPSTPLLATLDLAVAALEGGTSVVLYLVGDAVYLVDPARRVRRKTSVNGFPPPAELLARAIDGGAEFWLSQHCAEYRRTKPTIAHSVMSAADVVARVASTPFNHTFSV